MRTERQVQQTPNPIPPKNHEKGTIYPFFQKLILLIKNSHFAQFIQRQFRSLKHRVTHKNPRTSTQEAELQTFAVKLIRKDTPETYLDQSQALVNAFKKQTTSDSKIRVLEELEDLMESYQENRRQWEDGLSDEEKTDYSQAFNYMLHKATEMEIGIEALKAEEQENADHLVAKIQEEAAAAANFDFLGPELSGKIKTHLENVVIWPEPVKEAIEKLKNRPARHEINDILDLLQIPRNSDLAKDLFNHNFL